MAHEIESMFSVKQTPWHGLGKIVQDAGSSAEAIELAGLNWGVEKRPLFYPIPDSSESFDYARVSEKFANVRSSDNSVLGVVGKTYKPLQNSDAFKFFDDALKAKDLVFETAGSLKGGRYVWILASISSGPIEVVKGDAVKPYFLLTNGHDGMRALSVGFTPIRVVCANTLAAAERNSNSLSFFSCRSVHN
jgi:phage/plasmid-like protein (TIGR03299 family)